ncbi:Spc98 family-domain-containing protein [Xylariaceae sp. FL0662B]|nr:Spc98 family-domain-containing protein [Xylariaceae sp. FL0662B]
MAYAATLSALTEELIEVITSTSNQSDSDRFNVLKESSLRKLRHHTFLRTNQFEVERALNGFEERFHVVNQDGLANALRERLDALAPYSNKWTPELLHFLLQLSDQPIQKSKLIDLELLREPDETSRPPLKWEDIAKEEGWDQERGLWKNVDFGGGSSDDGYVEDESDTSPKSEDTSMSSIEARYRARPEDFIVAPQAGDGLDAIQRSQLWRNAVTPKDSAGRSQKIPIPEFHVVSEVLFMLNGLENTLFNIQGVPSSNYQLKHTSWEVYKALLGSFSEANWQLSILRDFVKQPQQIPLLQVFQDAIEKRLCSFDGTVTKLQSRYVGIQQDVVISLARVIDDVKPHLQPLASVSDIVQQLQQAKLARPFHYLELLFDAACVAQLKGEDTTYRYLATIFFECFQVYLRPIRLWMEAGELIDGDKTFFISSAPTQFSNRQVWTNQFLLRKSAEGTLHAPRFLQPAVSKIFTTGKSVVVLKLLGKHQSAGTQTPEPSFELGNDFMSELNTFVPFSEVFNDVFERWMQTKHHAASEALQQALFESCSLWSVLDALQHLYLMTDSSRTDSFAFAIFNNIDILNPNWHDRFTLTEMAHEAFDTIPNAHRIGVSVSADAVRNVNHVRKSVRKGLPSVKVIYRLSWPVRIVLTDESLSQYQAVFTFLLQLRRASYVLQRHRLMSDGTAHVTSDQAIYYGLRSKLLWFCDTLHSYLTMLVLGPLITQLQADIQQAEDVDAMIESHCTFTKRMINEMCLGSKLDPIRQCMLDVFDLAIRLQDARLLESEREREEAQELSRLSVMSSPRKGGNRRYIKTSEVEDETFLNEQDKSAMMQDVEKNYTEVLNEIRMDFDRHLKFIAGGLRGVARASGDAAAGKWDTLAEMLEVGIRG